MKTSSVLVVTGTARRGCTPDGSPVEVYRRPRPGRVSLKGVIRSRTILCRPCGTVERNRGFPCVGLGCVSHDVPSVWCEGSMSASDGVSDWV